MTNSKSTKRALLSSILALVLCFAMLLGTTFAWFTDTAKTSVNKIQAGTLDIDLQVATEYTLEDRGEDGFWFDDIGGWESVDGKTLSFIRPEGHEYESVLWEPGCTHRLPPLRVVNNGNLAVKFKVAVTGIMGDAKLNEAIEWTVPNDEYFMQDSYTVLQPGAFAAFTMKGHMKEDAGNEYQGLSIDGIAITVYATQAAVEYDSFNNTYDKDATLPSIWDGTSTEELTADENDVYHITNAAQFAKYLENTNTGKAYVLDCDIDLGGNTITFVDDDSRVYDGKFDGQGHVVSNFVLEGGMYTSLFGYTHDDGGEYYIKNLTVKNAVVNGSDSQVGVILGGMNAGTLENCSVYDSTVIGTKKVGAVVGYVANAVVKDCYAENCNVYCTENREDQVGTVIGFINTTDGLTDLTSNNTGKNVATAKNIKLVSNAEELAAALNNAGNAPSYDRNIVLTNDIDGSNWTAIPGGSNYPAVMIDGNGHDISNLSSCLFDELAARDFVFKNINFTNVNIHNENTSRGDGVAVIVGNAQSNGGGSYTITNCNIYGGSIKSDNGYAAGFIGLLSGNTAQITINDCSVKNVAFSGNDATGGLVGCSYSPVTITECVVTGNSIHGGDTEAYSSAALVGTALGACDVNATGVTVSGNACTYNGGNGSYTVNSTDYGYIFIGSGLTYTVNGTTLS